MPARTVMPAIGQYVPADQPRWEREAAVGDPRTEFESFFELSYRPLSRLAYLLTSDHENADDLTGDTLLAVWRQWDRVREVDDAQAYVRRIMANLAASRVRRAVRERTRLTLLWSSDAAPEADPTVAVTVQSALAGLPAGRRACVVLRHAFDLSEREVAEILGITVGTVKSQTSKAVKQLTVTLATGASSEDEERSS